MTEAERRAAEFRSIMKMAGVAEQKEEAKPEAEKKPAKKTKGAKK